LSYGRECRPEIPCGIAQSNDGKDYRLDPAPTKSVGRSAEGRWRHTSRADRCGRRRAGSSAFRTGTGALRQGAPKGKKRNGFRSVLAGLARTRQRLGGYSWVVRLFTSSLDLPRYLLARTWAYLGQIRSVHHVDTRSDDPGRRGRITSLIRG